MEKMKSSYQLIGKLTSKGGFKKEGNYDSLEVRYYYKTLDYSPKVSIILQSFNKLNGEDKEFERKSFRINCENLDEAGKIILIAEMLIKSVGFVFGSEMRKSIAEMTNEDKKVFFSETLNSISNKKTKNIKENFKLGFKEAIGMNKY